MKEGREGKDNKRKKKMTGKLAHPPVRPLALPITCQHNDTKTLNIVIDINHSTGL